jgi:hypothetical protein
VSLVGSVLESLGIVTVALSALPEITAHLAAPRTLVVPFGLGSPMGPPDAPDVQRRVLEAALALAASEDETPVTRTFSGAV